MKRLIIPILVVVMLTACATESRQQYDNMREETRELVTYDEFKDLGKAVCRRLDDGATPVELIEVLRRNGWSNTTSRDVIWNSKYAYCP